MADKKPRTPADVQAGLAAQKQEIVDEYTTFAAHLPAVDYLALLETCRSDKDELVAQSIKLRRAAGY